MVKQYLKPETCEEMHSWCIRGHKEKLLNRYWVDTTEDGDCTQFALEIAVPDVGLSELIFISEMFDKAKVCVAGCDLCESTGEHDKWEVCVLALTSTLGVHLESAEETARIDEGLVRKKTEARKKELIRMARNAGIKPEDLM